MTLLTGGGRVGGWRKKRGESGENSNRGKEMKKEVKAILKEKIKEYKTLCKS